jgi:hypothetical protein
LEKHLPKEKDGDRPQFPLLLRLLIVIGIPYFIGHYNKDEVPVDFYDHLATYGFGLGTILRYPLELIGFVN